MIKLAYLCDLFKKIAEVAGQNFDFDYFKSLDNIKDIFNYAKQNLQSIGSAGSSRKVFILNKRFVLKIALPDNLNEGIHQNKDEYKISKIFPEITANVINNHQDYYWIITQLARPLVNQNELIKALNLNSALDLGLLFGKFPPQNHKLKKEPNPIAMYVSKLVNDNILPRDVIKSDSWGYIMPDNKLVLIDYGNILKK